MSPPEHAGVKQTCAFFASAHTQAHNRTHKLLSIWNWSATEKAAAGKGGTLGFSLPPHTCPEFGLSQKLLCPVPALLLSGPSLTTLAESRWSTQSEPPSALLVCG